jgi:HSP20 family molecular chaperone IbpA
MKYDPEKVGMNLAIEIENKENNMVLNYYYDSKTNYYFKQDGDEYVVSIDMPGIKKTDLSITISKEGNDNTLSIKAQNKDRNYSQNLKVSNKFDESNVKACLSEGVLKIRMKLKEEASTKHKVEIE